MTPTNWPNPERLGEPMFPERDGLHLINMGAMIGMYWSATHQHYSRVKDWKRGMSPSDVSDFEYHGPCLTPSQINEMLAGERERCADVCRAMSFDNVYEKPARVTLEIADMAIRNLGAAP